MTTLRTFGAGRVVGLATLLVLVVALTAFDLDQQSNPDASTMPAQLTSTDPATAASGVQELAPIVGEPSTESGPWTLTPIGAFDIPVELTSRVGDDRSFVVELGGRIVAVSGVGETVVLDISDLTEANAEQGLLGAAFHPTEPFVYVHYIDNGGDSVIAEYGIDPVTAVADPATARTVLRVDQPYENHNGGEIAFGPDSYLYIGFGDGGLSGDPDRSALDLSSPLGKLLRIDPLVSNGEPFTVPADNPFVSVPDADPTIWSVGLRNPWKFSFDSQTSDLWIADVGQDQFEEINFAPMIDGESPGRGLSFGWSAREGDARFNLDQDDSGHTDPFLTYERVDGKCSISGGAVYRGSIITELDGWYVYGDYCTGQVWAFDTTAAPDARRIVELAQVDALVAIAVGGDGELYAASGLGGVYRIE